ncbi:response regulator [Ornithinimicrobium sp. CNJ-824]|uniref:response regulator n=1 Tax=Ornithinimicrobium sp. CNJ-824 TaxID=1904966 RepID=UPI001EDA91F9|nr:response regulator [Ornithinimicrobium sp. CNJ-824]
MSGVIRTALVVDDEPQIRALLAAYLARDGFVVREAGTGAEALRQAGLEPPPDVVLLDVGLPDLDGMEVLRRLRRERDLPVVMVSARAEGGGRPHGSGGRGGRLRHQAVPPPGGGRAGVRRAPPCGPPRPSRRWSRTRTC